MLGSSNLWEISLLILLNSLSLFLIIVVLANSNKHNSNRWFVLVGAFLMGWVNSAYLGFSLNNISYATVFYRLNDFFVALFLIASYQFCIEGFLEIKNNVAKFVHYTTTMVFMPIALFTTESTLDVIKRPWGNESLSGPAYYFIAIYSLVFAAILFALFVFRYYRYTEARKEQVKYFLIGTALFIGFNIVFNVVTPLITGTARYQHFGDYSAILFLVFTAYAIVGKKFMDIRIALTALLIGIIGMFIAIDIFLLSHSLWEQGLKMLILVLFAAVSVLLVRSVLSEIQQREALAKANVALDKSRQSYIDLATEQKDIIDVMGHEIRTPLTAIVQEIKIHKKHTLPIEGQLLEEAQDKEQLRRILPYVFDTIKTVDRASAHAVSLVTDMLETARLDKKRFELNYETFELVGLVRSNVELMRRTVDSDDVSVRYQIDFVDPKDPELMVEADKTRIGQAVYALLNNAIKYRDPEKETADIQVSVGHDSSSAWVTVADNGIGIDREDIAKLGRKFMRLNPKSHSNLPRPGGTGLGLFVVKGIMDHHKGEMRVGSDGIGKGSVFTLEFPIRKN